jgi:hypothetical protein
MPESATTTNSEMPCRALNCSMAGINVLVSALFPANISTSNHNPSLGHQQLGGDLRIDPAFLAHTDLAELVRGLHLEVERREVIHHQPDPATTASLR